jgi:peptidylprolyl isomerase
MAKKFSFKFILVLLVLVAIIDVGIYYFLYSDNIDSNNTNQEVENMNPIVLFETTKGNIKIELFEDKMPITAGNFRKLVEEGFYDETKFHRVIDGFMIQGGDPLSKDDTKMNDWGTGGSETIKDEFVKGLSNVRGTLAMANTGQANSGSSQFFINLEDNTGLDFDKQPFSSKHPVFGKVIEGMNIVDTIAKVQTNPLDRPIEHFVIKN